MRSAFVLLMCVSLSVTSVAVGALADGPGYEVWLIDQSDTRSDGGGTLYVYPGDAVSGLDAASAVPEVIDLGGAARDRCLAETGSAPRRPHMLDFDARHEVAIISFVATGHVLFLDAAKREPIACIDVGAQAHAAFSAPDRSFVLVANQNGKLLQRIRTDYGSGAIALDAAATLDLATCTTPSGAACEDAALRPDNAPICPVIDAASRLAFTTLRGGGLFVIDARATPMAIVAEYDRETIHPNGCGGLQVGDKLYLTAGGGTSANPLEWDLYAFSLGGFASPASGPNAPAPRLILSRDGVGFVDAHGSLLTRDGRYLWVGDRAANLLVVVDTRTDSVVDEIPLAGAASADPAPDLMDLAPAGNRAFLALRGPNPLTANVAGVNNAVGSTPGLGIVRVEAGGARGVLQAVASITHVVDGVERADAHAVRVRVL